MPEPTTNHKAAPIRLREAAIWDGKYFARGEVLPVSSIENLPMNLRPLVASGDELEADKEREGPLRANFSLNETFEVTDDDRLGKRLKSKAARDLARLQANAEEEAELEEEQANDRLPPDVEEDLMDSHREHIERQIAEARFPQERDDAAVDAVIAEQAPQPLYVKRGSRHYVSVDKAKLRQSEAVYVKQTDGRLQFIGETSGDPEPVLPDVPLQL